MRGKFGIAILIMFMVWVGGVWILPQRTSYAAEKGYYWNFFLGETREVIKNFYGNGVHYTLRDRYERLLRKVTSTSFFSWGEKMKQMINFREMLEPIGTDDIQQSDKQLDRNPIVTMEMQNGDIIKMELYPQIAPKTVENFISLINNGFYNGLTFHRVMPDFMVQGGDPNGDGTGGPGYTIEGEFSENGFQNDLKHEVGVISMARSNDYNSAGSQFFIVTDENSYFSLDGKYAGFGRVTEGMDAIYRIANSETVRKEYSPSLQKIIDESGTVHSKELYDQYLKETAEMERPIHPPVIKRMTVEVFSEKKENQPMVLQSYRIDEEQIAVPDIIIGDDDFDTQLADILSHFSRYEGKTIEIQGFYMEDSPYTFIGRYSEVLSCPYCPQGYSYFEYEWHGQPKELNLVNEGSWLRMRGVLKRGKDFSGQEYFYIDAKMIDVMNEWGVSTVSH